jgi:hypothetical protein
MLKLSRNPAIRMGLDRRKSDSPRGIELWVNEAPSWSMSHMRGAPCHPQARGKIERGRQALRNRVLLENHCPPGDFENRVAAVVGHCDHGRCHESLDHLAPPDVCFGRGAAILLEREKIKRQTGQNRRLQHRAQAA